jgi:hypothetical protein
MFAMICLPIHIEKNSIYVQYHENKGHAFEIPTQNIPFKGLSEGDTHLEGPHFPCKSMKTGSAWRDTR